MAWRMAIEHVTRYRYAGPVATSYNEARLTPQTGLTQTTVDARVTVEPAAHVSRYWDYWATLVHAFDVHERHTEMTVKGESVVERSPFAEPDPGPGRWDEVETPVARDRLCEFLGVSGFTPFDTEIAAVGTWLRAESATPGEAVDRAAEWVHSQLEYQAGTTDVSTSAVEAWRNGRGVCQDFVHLSLAVLRAAGVPARYVSGYLHPDPEPELGVTALGESHAWVEAWVGDWRGFDPTNLLEIGGRHVLVARGRDYGDVPPLKGIYSGSPAQESEVTVELTRLA